MESELKWESWTEEEDNLVRDNYAKMGVKMMKLLPNRSRVAIRFRARQLGIAFDKSQSKWTDEWSNEELHIMKENYARIGPTAVLKLLPKRSKDAVNHQARLLGVFCKNRKRILNISQTEAAYIAGLVDGEGWIGFSEFKDERYPIPKVAIANTNYAIIEWLLERFTDLSAHVYKRPATETQKPTYKMQISAAASVQALLEQISPYMIIKKERALLMMEYTSSRVGKRPLEPHTVDAWPIVTKIKTLNKVGPINGVKS